MEDQTAFDLNPAIQRWREDLARSSAFQNENLNELESHLRDSVAALQSRGLSAEEAFVVATRRLGQSHQLESEFSKLNQGNIWIGRVVWILIGLQVWPFFDGLTSGIAGNLFALGSRTVPHSGIVWPIFVSWLTQLPALIAAVWLTWVVLRKSDKLGEWIAVKLPKRSSFVLCCISACVLAFLSYAPLVLLSIGWVKFSGERVGLVTMSFIARSRNFIAPLRAIGFAVLTLVLARKLVGLQKIKADHASFDPNELKPHLRDSVAALQTCGLSAGEGLLIAMLRSGQRRQLEPEFEKNNRNIIWVERAMWMLIGIQVWPFFDKMMSGIAGSLFALGWRNVYHSAAAFGNARPVFFSALVQLPALVAAVWLSWKVLRNSRKIGEWIASKLPKRSSFGLCCVAASVFVLLLHALVMFLPAWWYKFSGERIATVSYIDLSRSFIMPLRIIGFAILTLLLARKRLVPEKASPKHLQWRL